MTRLDPLALPLTGSCLIEAGAGTGKTYTIASIFLRLVLSGRPVREILVVTFTEAATAELKDRLRRRLREAFDAFQSGTGGDDPLLARMLASMTPEEHVRARQLLMAALSGFDESAVFTIHGFCLRVLRENAFESGVMFDAELSMDPAPVYRDIAADYWALETYDLPGAWVRFLKEKNSVTTATLATLLGRVAGHPDRLVLPDLVDASGDVALFQELYGQARTVWQRERAGIEAIFVTHPGVNRKSYSKRYLPGWLAALDAYFEEDAASTLHGDGILERFTQSRLAEIAGSLKGAPEPPRHPFFDLCDQIMGLGQRWRIQFQRRFVTFGLAALAGRKADLGLRFFDDLIQDLDRALSSDGNGHLARRIRSRYPVALIDEFQDTDLTQYRIFRTLYQHGEVPFFMIGDPKQSIYAFRGADVFAYLQAARDAGESVHTLTVNWRSDPALIRAVNTIFDARRAPRPFGMGEIGFHPAEARDGAEDGFALAGELAPPLGFLFVRSPAVSEEEAGTGRSGSQINKAWAEENLPGMTAADICRLIDVGTVREGGAPRPIVPGDIAVLVRTNRQGRLMQAALRSAGLPTVLTSLESVFESGEAGELGRVLRAVATPPRDSAMYTAMATDFLGVSGNRMEALRSGDPEWEWWVARFREWHRVWHEQGFVQMVTRLFYDRAPGRDRGFLTRLLSLVDGERRVTNFQHLAELLQTAARREHLGPAGVLRWFDRQRALGEATEAHELRLESDARALRIVTIHKSKGLEYPVVYLPYLWESGQGNIGKPPAQCHLPREGNRPVFDLGSDALAEHLALAHREQRIEDLRLLYVALTRARHACRVVWGGFKGFENSALSYLLHRPDETGTPDFSATAHHARALDDGRMLSDLERLARQADGGIEIRDLGPDPDAAYAPEGGVPPRLRCRHPDRIVRRRWRMESFSRLVAEAAHDVSPEEELGLDHDQRVTGSAVPTTDASAVPVPGGETPVPLAAFSRGAAAGTFFHAIYEHLDFTETDPVVVNGLVSRKLTDHGFDSGLWEKTIGRAISGTLDCSLDPDRPELTLRRISNARRLNELAFLFPAAESPDEKDPVTPGRLGRIFESHASAAVPGEYARRVAALRFPAIRGFLKGFMDLVFEYDGKWYLADYKSNHLGERFGDYGPESLSRVMADHHYFLQYHLYLAALHRYLSCRLPGYDYDRHFGGVYYLFIRGMSPETGSVGVFRDRPGSGMVAALSGLF